MLEQNVQECRFAPDLRLIDDIRMFVLQLFIHIAPVCQLQIPEVDLPDDFFRKTNLEKSLCQFPLLECGFEGRVMRRTR